MRKRSEDVRRRIVDAAYESFWRLGFRRSTVDLIAARAGLTKRTVYGYFRSKDDLLAAVLQRYDDLLTSLPFKRSGSDLTLSVQLPPGGGMVLGATAVGVQSRAFHHTSPSGWRVLVG